MIDIYDLAYELYVEDINKYKYEKIHTKEFFFAYRDHSDYIDYFTEAYKIIYTGRINKINKLKDKIHARQKINK